MWNKGYKWISMITFQVHNGGWINDSTTHEANAVLGVEVGEDRSVQFCTQWHACGPLVVAEDWCSISKCQCLESTLKK
jgi:hypothetical protein